MAFYIVCLHTHLSLLLLTPGFPQSFSLSCQTYLPTFTTKRQASQAYTTSRLVLGLQQRVNSMHGSWTASISIIRTRKVALESPSLDCVNYYYLLFPESVLIPNFPATMVPASVIISLGLMLSGWAAQCHLHWIVTDIVSQFLLIASKHFRAFQGIACIGLRIVVSCLVTQAYNIDAFTLHTASGTMLSSVISLDSTLFQLTLFF